MEIDKIAFKVRESAVGNLHLTTHPPRQNRSPSTNIHSSIAQHKKHEFLTCITSAVAVPGTGCSSPRRCGRAAQICSCRRHPCTGCRRSGCVCWGCGWAPGCATRPVRLRTGGRPAWGPPAPCSPAPRWRSQPQCSFWPLPVPTQRHVLISHLCGMEWTKRNQMIWPRESDIAASFNCRKNTRQQGGKSCDENSQRKWLDCLTYWFFYSNPVLAHRNNQHCIF